MPTLTEKISHLEKILNQPEENYADSFKADIIEYFDSFEIENIDLSFLSSINTFEEIENWITKLTSRIVLKFDEKSESINDFIADYIALG